MHPHLRWLTTVYGDHEMFSITMVTADHFFEQATNTKSKPLYKTMGVCNFIKLFLEVA